MNHKFLCYLALTVICFSNFVYGARHENFVTTTAQTVADRIEEVQRYYQFAQNRCAEGTDCPVWAETELMGYILFDYDERVFNNENSHSVCINIWRIAAHQFQLALDAYNGNNLQQGDTDLHKGLVFATEGVFYSTLQRNPSGQPLSETADDVLRSFSDEAGSPAYYPQGCIDMLHRRCEQHGRPIYITREELEQLLGGLL